VSRVGEIRNVRRVLVEKSEDERPLGRPRLIWENVMNKRVYLSKNNGNSWTGFIFVRTLISGRLL